MSFNDKIILVTGSGSGIGAAAVTSFAKEGADVVIVDNNEKRANDTGEKCREFGARVLIIVADVSNNEQAKNVIQQTIDSFGRLDVLVNNAGITRQGGILDGSIMDTYDDVMTTNLRSIVLMTSLAAPHLVKTKGCIINMSSVSSTATRTSAMYPIYGVSKAGVDAFTRASALELSSSGVRVNAVSPGPVTTNLLTHTGINHSWDKINKFTALGKCCDPDEIANLIVYLASDKAEGITGSIFLIDNGMALI